MKKLLLPLCAAAILGACANHPDTTFASGRIVPQPVAYYPGFGVVDRVVASPSFTAAAGGGAAVSQRPGTSSTDGADIRTGAAGGLNRVYIRMDDGRVQFIDTASTELQRGMRVELLPDRTVRIQP
jgi:hypothetical protein